MARQRLGTAASASSDSMDRSMIDAKDAIINSGYCSGRSHLDTKKQKASSSVLRGGMGTARSYNAQSNNEIKLSSRKRKNLGALSGDSSEGCGTVDKENKGCSQTPTSSSASKKPRHRGPDVSGTQGSFNAGPDVSGTQGSFNAGSKISGTPVPLNAGSCAAEKGCKQDSSNCIPGSENSFNNEKISKEAAIKAACEASVSEVKGNRVIGTRKSFNVEGRDSKIEGCGAHINSGTYAGITGTLITENPSESCSGTDKSFNARSYSKVDIRSAKLNTGAYSGCTGKLP